MRLDSAGRTDCAGPGGHCGGHPRGEPPGAAIEILPHLAADFPVLGGGGPVPENHSEIARLRRPRTLSFPGHHRAAGHLLLLTVIVSRQEARIKRLIQILSIEHNELKGSEEEEDAATERDNK